MFGQFNSRIFIIDLENLELYYHPNKEKINPKDIKRIFFSDVAFIYPDYTTNRMDGKEGLYFNTSLTIVYKTIKKSKKNLTVFSTI